MPVNLPSSPSGYKGSAKYNEIEKLRISKAFWLSVFGLGLAAVLVGFLVSMGWDTPEIASVVGLFTSILGTLVGLFFGLQVGSAGKEKAEERADNAQKKAEALLLAAADIGLMDKARSLYPDLF